MRVLVLPDSLSNPPESVCHERRGSEKVCGGAEASYGQVALVLYGAVAARWRHILRHVGRFVRGSIGVPRCRQCGDVK
jgi:hypothetical protein